MTNIKWSTYSDEALAWLDEHRPTFDNTNYTRMKVDVLMRMLHMLRYNRVALEQSPSSDCIITVGDDPCMMMLPTTSNGLAVTRLAVNIGWGALVNVRGGQRRQLQAIREELLYCVDDTDRVQQKLWLRRAKMVIDALALEDTALSKFTAVYDGDWFGNYPRSLLERMDSGYTTNLLQSLQGSDGLEFLDGTKCVHYKPVLPPKPSTLDQAIIHGVTAATQNEYKIIFLPKV